MDTTEPPIDVWEPMPAWLRPPRRGFTAEDLDHLPELPAHSQLIDGSLVIPSYQTVYHSVTLGLLEEGLRRTNPDHLRVRRQMTVVLSERQRPEPDVIVIDADALLNEHETAYPATAVHLAVEVVSPDSEIRDRERKPQLYAAAGIPSFWLVEMSARRPVVQVYERDRATASYTLTGIHHDRLQLDRPFPIDIDLTEVDQR